MSDKTKVAILGGGPAGLSAAFHLARQNRTDLEITVYQMGWRLGGKGASGRPVEPPHRIEEHGIHLFGNFYPNAFGMVHECYQQPENQRKNFFDEFQPSNFQLFTEKKKINGEERWLRFTAQLPRVGAQPWESQTITISADQLIDKVFITIRQLLVGTQEIDNHFVRRVVFEWPVRRLLAFGLWLFRKQLRKIFTNLVPVDDSKVLKNRNTFSSKYPERGGTWESKTAKAKPGTRDKIQMAWKVLQWVGEKFARFDGVRHTFTEFDHLIACLHGFHVFDLENRGIQSVDDWDHREWLEAVGVHPITMESPVVRLVPNICFQYPGGDTAGNPRMSAAAYLSFIFRQVMASGDNLFFFKRGTGESVVEPLYKTLLARGVKFRFFHKVLDVVPSKNGVVEHFDVEIQAKPKHGNYDPLFNLDGLGVWPSEPLFDRLEGGDKIKEILPRPDLFESWSNLPERLFDMGLSTRRKRLDRGKDFDFVVLALPVSVHPHACPSLIEQRRWKAMHDGLETIPTQALQIWYDGHSQQLGIPPKLVKPPERHAGPSFRNPMSTWTDFSDLVELEHWGEKQPNSLFYFCGPLRDNQDCQLLLTPNQTSSSRHEQARKRIRKHVKGEIQKHVNDMGGLLTTLEQGKEEGRFLRANVEPHDRYRLTPPGIEQKLWKSWESGYKNMALAGDWTFTGFNIASFEAAVISGKVASFALTQEPALEEIWGFYFFEGKSGTISTPAVVPMIK